MASPAISPAWLIHLAIPRPAITLAANPGLTRMLGAKTRNAGVDPGGKPGSSGHGIAPVMKGQHPDPWATRSIPPWTLPREDTLTPEFPLLLADEYHVGMLPTVGVNEMCGSDPAFVVIIMGTSDRNPRP